MHSQPPKPHGSHNATRPAVNGSALNDSTPLTAKQAHAPPITQKLPRGKIAAEKHTGTQRTSTTEGKLQKQQPPKSITCTLRATKPQNPQQQKKEHAGLLTTKPNKRRCTRNNDHIHPKITNYFQSAPNLDAEAPNPLEAQGRNPAHHTTHKHQSHHATQHQPHSPNAPRGPQSKAYQDLTNPQARPCQIPP
jgi:hypothetical protein